MLVVIVVACVLAIFWTRPLHKDLRNHAAFRDTAESLSVLHACLEQYALLDPEQAIETLSRTHIILTDNVLQMHLRSYLTIDNTGMDLFHDGWGEDIHIKVLQLKTNKSEGIIEAQLVLWSNGKNRIDEDGKGDDIVLGPLVTPILIVRKGGNP